MAERKKNVSRRKNEERRISALLLTVYGQFTAKYVVLDPRAEIRSSSSQPSILISCARHTDFFLSIGK